MHSNKKNKLLRSFSQPSKQPENESRRSKELKTSQKLKPKEKFAKTAILAEMKTKENKKIAKNPNEIEKNVLPNLINEIPGAEASSSTAANYLLNPYTVSFDLHSKKIQCTELSEMLLDFKLSLLILEISERKLYILVYNNKMRNFI